MRIALCLSGQPRYLDMGYRDVYRCLLSKYSIDVFIHTWWNENLIGKRFDFAPNLSYGRTGMWESDTINKIQHLYKPVDFMYEQQKLFKIHSDVTWEMQNPVSLYSMTYSINESNNLKKNNEKKENIIYDIVIRCRFDIVINSFNLNLNDIDLEKIYVSGEINPLINDQFAISSSENMDYYADFYNRIEEYYNSGYRDFVNEHFLRHHLSIGKKQIYYCDKNEFYCNIIKM